MCATCVSLCTTVIHNTAQNSSDNYPSYPPDNHHCSDNVYWSEGGGHQHPAATGNQQGMVTQFGPLERPDC